MGPEPESGEKLGPKSGGTCARFWLQI